MKTLLMIVAIFMAVECFSQGNVLFWDTDTVISESVHGNTMEGYFVYPPDTFIWNLPQQPTFEEQLLKILNEYQEECFNDSIHYEHMVYDGALWFTKVKYQKELTLKDFILWLANRHTKESLTDSLHCLPFPK